LGRCRGGRAQQQRGRYDDALHLKDSKSRIE
jgi:hypothetical protein